MTPTSRTQSSLPEVLAWLKAVPDRAQLTVRKGASSGDTAFHRELVEEFLRDVLDLLQQAARRGDITRVRETATGTTATMGRRRRSRRALRSRQPSMQVCGSDRLQRASAWSLPPPPCGPCAVVQFDMGQDHVVAGRWRAVSVCSKPDRDVEPECAASSGGAGHAHRATHGLRKLGHKGQAESRAAEAASIGRVNL